MPRGYGYGNARLRAMRSRLLTPADYDALLAKSTMAEVITALSKTPYQAEVETALIQVGPDRCVVEAIRQNLTHTLTQIRHFFEDEPGELISLQLRKWDRHNLLAILRGQFSQTAAEQIISVLVPVGQLDEAALRELARQPGVRAAIDLLTTWALPYARPLRQVQPRHGAGPDLDQLELALNQFHYRSLLQELGPGNSNHRILREQVQTDIDLVNLRTALRLVNLPGGEALVMQRYQSASARPLLIEPGGFIAAPRLAELITAAGKVEDIIRELQDTRYSAALQAGWSRYQAGGGNLAALERELERWQARETAALFARDPLSIAISLGFVGCKEIEAANLRLIAQAVALDLDRELIKQDLITV